MVNIDWVVLCESAFRDDSDRMSLIGIAAHLPVPSLPLVLVEHVVVARLTHVTEAEDVSVRFGVKTPRGRWLTPTDDDATGVSFSGGYLIVALRNLPLREEGVHRFEVGLSNGSTAAVDVRVWLCKAEQPPAHVH